MNILIDTRTVLPEQWLRERYTNLFIAIDQNGNYVHPRNAKVLECWRFVPEQVREQGPAFQEIPTALAVAMVHYEGRLYSLWTNIQDKHNGTVISWLKCLHRYPEGDLNEVLGIEAITS